MKKLPQWIISDIILVAAALILRFALKGYDFVAYALLLAAALIPAYVFLGKKLKILISVVLALGLVYFVIVEIPIVSSAKTSPQPEAQYLVVLGAGVNGTEPSLSLHNRLEAAKAYLEEYPESIAILTGGQGPGEDITEAQCMYDWLMENGVAPERLIKEAQATSTEENFRYSFDIIRSRGDEPNGNVAVVSSEYHLYRATLLAEAQGVSVKTVAAPTSYIALRINYFIREAFAVTALWVFG